MKRAEARPTLMTRRHGQSTFFIFGIADELCALPVEAVREIVPMASLAHSPGLPSVVEGFLNLRGTAVPVLRLRRLFDLPPAAPGLYTPLIVMRNGPALVADKAVDVAAISPDEIVSVDAAQLFNGCTERQFPFAGRTVHVLSPGRLLLNEEERRIAEFQSRAQQYLNELEAPAE